MNSLPIIFKINKEQRKNATSNQIVLETTHFVTYIEKIMCINVSFHMSWRQA